MLIIGKQNMHSLFIPYMLFYTITIILCFSGIIKCIQYVGLVNKISISVVCKRLIIMFIFVKVQSYSTVLGNLCTFMHKVKFY